MVRTECQRASQRGIGGDYGLTFWLPALTLNCMSSPTVVVALSGPAALPFSAPNLRDMPCPVSASHPVALRGTCPPASRKHSLGPVFPLGDRMADLPHLRPPLDLSGDLDLLAILVVSPFGRGDRAVRVGDLGRGGKGDA